MTRNATVRVAPEVLAWVSSQPEPEKMKFYSLCDFLEEEALDALFALASQVYIPTKVVGGRVEKFIFEMDFQCSRKTLCLTQIEPDDYYLSF